MVDSLERATDALAAEPNEERFVAARRRYKPLEGVVEFYAPSLAAALNGRRQEVDDDDAPPPAMLAAAGFPAIEAALFARNGTIDTAMARQAARGLRDAEGRLSPLIAALQVTDAQLFEIGREELGRVSTLGIAGFDAPVTHRGISESGDALDGLRRLYAVARGRRDGAAAQWTATEAALVAAARYLHRNSDFGRFDRLDYIVRYDRPAANALDAWRRASGAPTLVMRRPWRLEAPSVYDANAFDPHAYAPNDAPRPTPALLALGARLFADPRLSGPGTRACVTCHQPARAFTDGRRLPVTLFDSGGSHAPLRNTPSLIGAGLQPAQFADERSVTLEEQVGEVLRSPVEMASSLTLVVSRLRRDESAGRAFAAAFPVGGDSSITERHVRQALAEYIRSLTHADSRFDAAVRGDTAALTPTERRGFNLFMGKAGCGTCHFAPLFGGTTPPRFLGSDVEVIGTPIRADQPARVDPDSGRARVDHWPTHLYAFKVPSLRDVARTAPYMHNGAFATLDDVLLFYDAGGAAGAGGRVPTQTLSADSLHLTRSERAAIIAFLRSLDEGGARSR
jgi:cytochrome c peroxidase